MEKNAKVQTLLKSVLIMKEAFYTDGDVNVDLIPYKQSLDVVFNGVQNSMELLIDGAEIESEYRATVSDSVMIGDIVNTVCEKRVQVTSIVSVTERMEVDALDVIVTGIEVQ